MGCGKQREAAAPIQSLVKLQAFFPEFAVEDLPSVKLQPRFLRLQWRTCPRAEHSDDDDDDDDYTDDVNKSSLFYLSYSVLLQRVNWEICG